jgi:hypothetical protein
MKAYGVLLGALVCLLGFLVFTRSDVETMLLRAPGALFQMGADGRISNLYTLKVINKTTHEIPVELRLEGHDGTIQIMGRGLSVPKEQLGQGSVLVELDAAATKGGRVPLRVGVYSHGKLLQTVKTVFVGPRSAEP